jgi:hypothetical protein
MIMADSGSAWPGSCQRWLPAWLPEISLPSLTFDGAKTASIQTLLMHTAYSHRATRGTITAVATDVMPCPARIGSASLTHCPADLFEYQAIAQGGWIMPDVAGCVI